MTKMKIPIGPEELIVEWLTEALCKRGTLKRGQVASCHAEVLGGPKGALGQVARLSLSYDTDRENAPRSLIAKFGPTNPKQRMLLNRAGFYEREIRFYQELADQVELNTPHNGEAFKPLRATWVGIKSLKNEEPNLS
jgi:hypothetical protein